MKRSMLCIAAGLSVTASAAFSEPQPKCLPRAQLVETLKSQYQETLTAGGLQTPTQMIEVWTSDSGSFTVISTMADGTACIMAAGQHWSQVAGAVIPGIAS